MYKMKNDRSQACLDLPCNAIKHIISVLHENGHQYLLLSAFCSECSLPFSLGCAERIVLSENFKK